MTDPEFRAAVLACLAYPGRAFVIDDGLTIKAWPSHDKAVQIPDYFLGGSMIRVALHLDGSDTPIVLGAQDTTALKIICEMIGYRYARERGRLPNVAIYDPILSKWLNADGTATAKQDGPQHRNVESDIRVGGTRV